MRRLLRKTALFPRNEEVLIAIANFSIFIFVMTAVVYETQRNQHAAIQNQADALYFTVTAPTTTGVSDITLPGTGRG